MTSEWKKDDFIYFPSHNCKRSLPLNSTACFYSLPLDGLTRLSTIHKYNMVNLKESKFPDKNHVYINVYIHHEPNTVTCTRWSKTHDELVSY